MNPDIPDSEQPCYLHNPKLWRHFCHASGRPVRPSEVWTEADVVQWLDRFNLWPVQNPRRV